MSIIPTDDILLMECIEALGDKAVILSKKESDAIWRLFKSVIPLDQGGKVEWEKIKNHISIHSPIQLKKKKSANSLLYILWNDASRPVIKTDLESAIQHFEDIIYLETWLFDPFDKYVVEILSTGNITGAGFV